MRILIDIDTALVVRGHSGRPHSLPEALKRVDALLSKPDNSIVLWSSRGLRYARRFARDNKLVGVRCISKPDQLITRF